MTAQEALKLALREVLAPAARSYGYKGSSPTWRRSSSSGDWAVVNVQSSSFSTAQSVRCVINLAVAPEPWLRWTRDRLGAAMPKAVSESLGLYRHRLHPAGAPSGKDVWWEVSDLASANAAAQDMVVQLELGGWPVLDRLLSRDSMLEQVLQGDLGLMKRGPSSAVFFARAEAVLLMGNGPSNALDEQLTIALDSAMQSQRAHAERFDTWARNQAQAATQ